MLSLSLWIIVGDIIDRWFLPSSLRGFSARCMLFVIELIGTGMLSPSGRILGRLLRLVEFRSRRRFQKRAMLLVEHCADYADSEQVCRSHFGNCSGRAYSKESGLELPGVA